MAQTYCLCMPQRQYCQPHIVAGQTSKALARIAFEDRSFPERWYQELLFRNPSLLPVDEIEPAFGPLVPLARELQAGSGSVDIAYINADGYMTLVETKLWKNPEARRDVVAQIIEYATSMSKWTYVDLCTQLRRAAAPTHDDPAASRIDPADADPLLALMKNEVDFDETRFIDNVTRNLRLGRFLLLIVGDGIKEGIEELAETMQESPHLSFTLALVETAVYKLGDESKDLLVQPRVLARTREIVRHVIEIHNGHPTAEVSVKSLDSGHAGGQERSRGITEAAFYEQLEKESGMASAEFARWFVTETSKAPNLHLTWSKDGPALWWEDDEGEDQACFMRLHATGQLSFTNGLARFCAKHGLPMSIADQFQNGLARLIPGSVRIERGNQGYTHLMASNGVYPSFASLAIHRDELLGLIHTAIDALARSLASTRDQPEDSRQ